jgi:hypothetical protein
VNVLTNDITTFLRANAACQCAIVSLNINNRGPKNVFQIRGKLRIALPQSQQQKLLGFKFVLPDNYPIGCPLVYLDEKENPEVVEMIDYLDKGNRI